MAVLVGLAFGAFPASAAQRRHVHRSRPGDMRALISAMQRDYRIPGMAVLIQKDGRAVSEIYAGQCSVELRVAMSRDCVFHLASASKMFASVAVMSLVDEGKLRLDDRVSAILPGLPAAWSEVTVRQLLAHTSGLPEIFANETYGKMGPEDQARLSPEQTIALLAHDPSPEAPGDRWRYNQTGFVLVGMIVEKLSGVPYRQYVQRRVFDRAGMAHASFGDSTYVVPGRPAAAYQWLDGRLQEHFYPYPPAVYPAAGANSSLDDLGRFFAAVDGGRLLSPASRALMWEPYRLTKGKVVDYAVGWSHEVFEGEVIVGHSGAGSVWLAYLPKARVTIVLLTNLNGVEHEFERRMQFGDPIRAIAHAYLRGPARSR